MLLAQIVPIQLARFLVKYFVGYVEGVPFTACTSGTSIIILASNFQRIQQIHVDSTITSIDCSTDVGRIAVACDTKVVIFEPTSNNNTNINTNNNSTSGNSTTCNNRLDYRWIQSAIIETSHIKFINVMSFNLDGTRLLTGGSQIHLWSLNQQTVSSTTTTTTTNNSIGEQNSPQAVQITSTTTTTNTTTSSCTTTDLASPTSSNKTTSTTTSTTSSNSSWTCIWTCNPANPIYYLKYSPDGTLFCSASKPDKIVKVWFEGATINSTLSFSFIYISHPKPISGLEWRRTCKYMPRGAVANVLITSAKDNASRIWVQTLLPDDCFLNLDQREQQYSQGLDPNVTESNNSNDQGNNINKQQQVHRTIRNQPHRQKLLKRLSRAFSQFKKKQPNSNSASSHSIKAIEKVANATEQCVISSSLIKPSLHFHLAGTIKGSQSSDKTKNSQFVIHWINNKDASITRSIETLLHNMFTRILHGSNPASTANNSPQSNTESCSESEETEPEQFDPNDDTITAESSKKLRHKLCQKMNKQRALAASGRTDESMQDIQKESSKQSNGRTSPASLVEEFDKKLEYLLNRWRTSTDLLFSINKADGTFTLWQVKYLDGEESGLFRNIQIDELSRLKSALPDYDAATMSSHVTAYSPSVYLEVKRAYLAVANSSNSNYNNHENSDQVGSLTSCKSESTLANRDNEIAVFVVTQHLSGILGLWKLTFESVYPKVQSIDLITRITGLPIEPTWLRDGYLIVEKRDNNFNLKTKWMPETRRDGTSNDDELSNVSESQVIAKIQASQVAKNLNILPQYHQKQLIELLAFGKLQRVKAILDHLVACLVASDPKNGSSSTAPKLKAHRSRTLSIVSNSPPVFPDSFDLDAMNVQQQVIEEVELDYTEVTSIQPLPLYSLLKADEERPKSTPKETKKETLFDDYTSFFQPRTQVEETLDEILGKSTLETLSKQKQQFDMFDNESATDEVQFNTRKANLLTRMLTHTHLPGLTNIDQMHLLAVADAVALFDASLDDYDADYETDSTGIATNIAIDSLDDIGLRFLTAMRQHIYLTKCLPIKQRNELKSVGIGTHNIVWAFHSESQEELLSLIPCIKRNKPEWAELREFGVGWWLRKLEVLRKVIEKTAQSAYQANQDPLDAALFYLAMKKKTLVTALLKRVNCDKRLLRLFEQDFSDASNRRKALKNAYALLGLHRFEHAAAFFILAGSIWDAVEVCINNLNDIQLAVVLIRLYDNDQNVPTSLKRLLYSEILGSKANDVEQYAYNPEFAHPDPFLRSIALWKLGDYNTAFSTLIEKQPNDTTATTTTTTSKSQSTLTTATVAATAALKNSISVDDSVAATINQTRSSFNFYLYIKDQPLVQRHKMTSIDEDSDSKRECIVERGRQLLFSEAQSYLDTGCPLLALEVLNSDKDLVDMQAQSMKFTACLHILLHELSAVPTGSQFLEWLKHSCNAVDKLCGNQSNVNFTINGNISRNNSNNNCSTGIGGNDNNINENNNDELNNNDDNDDSWIKSNEPILRTMLTYCNMHCAKESSLIAIRQELLNLLDKGEDEEEEKGKVKVKEEGECSPKSLVNQSKEVLK